MTIRLSLLVAVFLSTVGFGQPARILVIFPFPSKSHLIFLSSIIRTLTQRGHEVVEYSPAPPKLQLSNYTHFEIHTEFENKTNNWSYEEFSLIAGGTQSIFGVIVFWFMGYSVCEDTFKNENIQKLVRSDEHFDLVLTETGIGQESMALFAHKFGAPLISLLGFGLHPLVNLNAGNALSTASIPDRTSYVKTDRMSFTERTTNFITTALSVAFYYWYHLPRQESMVKQYYKRDTPPLDDIIRNISLYITNTHPMVEYPQAITPNIISVAGVGISADRSQLPQGINEFMDGAKDGVIYFSLGTVVPAHILPNETLQVFVNVFGKLKQRVIWKIELDNIPGLSKNVKLVKWVPQPGVLGHPKCLLFITHGGLFSQQEALQAGVPTVGIPFFGDQGYNVRFSEYRSFGVKLDFGSLSETSAITAINTVLNNPRYRENAKRLSKIFRDQPLSPQDTVAFWVEYVLRHAGAHHLRPASTRLSWYQLALLDVLAAVLLPLVAFLYVIYKVVTINLCCRIKRETLTQSKKKD